MGSGEGEGGGKEQTGYVAIFGENMVVSQDRSFHYYRIHVTGGSACLRLQSAEECVGLEGVGPPGARQASLCLGTQNDCAKHRYSLMHKEEHICRAVPGCRRGGRRGGKRVGGKG